MAGPSKRGDIWYYRKATPTDLWNRREELLALRLQVIREVWRSLETKEKAVADRRYRDIATDQEEQWDRWRILLEADYRHLTEKERMALAIEDAVSFRDKHEENPSEIPPPRRLLEVLAENLRDHYCRLSLRDGDSVFTLSQELLPLSRPELEERLSALQSANLPVAQRDLVAEFLKALTKSDEAAAYAIAKGLADRHRVRLTTSERSALSEQVGRFRERARNWLGENAEGNYETPAWAANPPVFVGGSRKTVDETFRSVIEERERMVTLGTAPARSPATFKKYRRVCLEFTSWRGSERIATVSKDEVRRWMEKLRKDGLSAKTLRDKVLVLSAVVKWAIRQNDKTIFPKGDPLEALELPEAQRPDSANRTYTKEQARLVLLASRDQRLAFKRWMPWLMAYSGMRIGEVSQLERNDLEEFGGHWFLHVRHDGQGKTTKTKTSRVVPIHPAVIREGFIEYARGANTALIFPEKRKQQSLGEWIRGDVLKEESRTPPPAHGFRHLFEDLRLGVMSDDVAAYITGRSTGRSSQKYGKSREMWTKLAAEMANIDPLL
ncbi:site-specific integrase [Oricola indica]|uniref:site-specific integrase n=1 Tax=Oricola indica TaxID=2872591 RepID=UPI001CC04D14|nr:site-specific integrase [Oricola indica]